MTRVFTLLLAIVAPATSATMRSPNPAGRTEAMLRHSVLTSHNQARKAFGVAPLAWSDLLAAEAMGHAQYMARTGNYGHDRTPGRRKKMGENLWRGQRGVFSYDVMVGVMVAEGRNFRPGAYPNNSRTGNWADVSHYTQIVWPTTTEVGCAIASSATTDYLVCRYAPTGNKDGYYLSAGQVPLAARAAGARSAQGSD